MAVIRWKVSEITKEWDGDTCEFKAEVISVHKDYLSDSVLFRAEKEMKVAGEFQENKLIKRLWR